MPGPLAQGALTPHIHSRREACLPDLQTLSSDYPHLLAGPLPPLLPLCIPHAAGTDARHTLMGEGKVVVFVARAQEGALWLSVQPPASAKCSEEPVRARAVHRCPGFLRASELPMQEGCLFPVTGMAREGQWLL